MQDKLALLDVVQFLLQLPGFSALTPQPAEKGLLYHASCHAEWSGLSPAKAPEEYRRALAGFLHLPVRLSPRCCGESGMGAITAPAIYNRLRARKQDQLTLDLADFPAEAPVIVACPSCKIGIQRSLMQMKRPNKAIHTLEYLAGLLYGADWQEQTVQKALAATRPGSPVRVMEFS